MRSGDAPAGPEEELANTRRELAQLRSAHQLLSVTLDATSRWSSMGPLSAGQAGHGKPITSPDSDFLHVPEPDQQLLSVMGEKTLRTARAAGQPQTLVVMQVYDLPEVELVFGRAAAWGKPSMK